MNDPAKPDTPTKAEHDAWVAEHGRPYTQRPVKRRRPKEITDMPAASFSIIDTYIKEDEGDCTCPGGPEMVPASTPLAAADSEHLHALIDGGNRLWAAMRKVLP